MSAPSAPSFDHEKLDVYRVSIEFLTLAYDSARRLPRGCADLGDQLRRASMSITLNIAEGSGETSAKEKARFYRMAHRSTSECAAILDILERTALLQNVEGRELLGRIAAMLTMLIRRHH